MEIDFVTLISQVGFPIAVATYVLIKLNATLLSVRDELQLLRMELHEYKRERAA